LGGFHKSGKRHYLRLIFLTIIFKTSDTVKLTAAPIVASTAVFNNSAEVTFSKTNNSPPAVPAFIELFSCIASSGFFTAGGRLAHCRRHTTGNRSITCNF
jgi:hypothetical protein